MFLFVDAVAPRAGNYLLNILLNVKNITIEQMNAVIDTLRNRSALPMNSGLCET